jgi:hypothetical protein
MLLGGVVLSLLVCLAWTAVGVAGSGFHPGDPGSGIHPGRAGGPEGSTLGSGRAAADNWENSGKNHENTAQKWDNSPKNWDNDPRNRDSTRILYDNQGRPMGYLVPKGNGGANYFDLSGHRRGYLPPRP